MAEGVQTAPEMAEVDPLLAEAQLTLAAPPSPPQRRRAGHSASDPKYAFREKRKVSYEYGFAGAGGGDEREDDDWAAAVMGYGLAEVDRDEQDDPYKAPSRPAKRPKPNPSERDPSKPLGGDAEARAVQLRAHPLAQIVEPDRVFCSACEKWVKLGQYAYYLHHWTQHLNTVHAPDRQRKKPGPKPGWQNNLKTPPKPKPAPHPVSAPVTPARPPGYRALVNGKVVELPLQPSSAEASTRLRNYNPQSATGKRAPLRNEQQRLQELVSDPEVYAVEMFRVRCRRCMRWVPLGHRGPYYTGQWGKHLLKCQGTANGVLPPGEEDMLVKLEPGDDAAPALTAHATNGAAEHAERGVDWDDAASSRQLTASPPTLPTYTLPPLPDQMPSSSSSRPLMTRAPLPPRPHQFYANPLPEGVSAPGGIPRPILLDPVAEPSASRTESPAPLTDSAISVEQPSLTPEDTPEASPPYDSTPLSAAELKILNPPDVFKRTDTSAREREEAFREDPLVAEVGECFITSSEPSLTASPEPRRVRCAMCDTWMKLGAESDYSPDHWLVHRKRCKERPNWLNAQGLGDAAKLMKSSTVAKAPRPSTNGAGPSTGRNGHPTMHGPLPPGARPVLLPVAHGSVQYLPNGMPVPVPVLLPTPPPQAAPRPPRSASVKNEDDFVFQAPGARLNELERRAQFERDPDVREIHTDAVLCNICGKWIKLSNTYPYASGNWSGLKGHKITCRKRHGLDVQHLVASRVHAAPDGSAPSSATEKRASARITKKLVDEEEALRRDSRVRRVVDGRAQCNACGKWLKIPNFRTHLSHRCRKMLIEKGLDRPDYDSESEGDAPMWKDEEELSDHSGSESAAESEHWWTRSPTPPPPRPLSPQPDYVTRYAMYLNPQFAVMAAPGQFTRSALPTSRVGFSAAEFAPGESHDPGADMELDDLRMLNAPDGHPRSPLTPMPPHRLPPSTSSEATTRLFLTQPPYRRCTHSREEDSECKPVQYLHDAGLVVPPPPVRVYPGRPM
ncbi:hypothetical protein AURDEDRAFT_174471 [Auricularia subglabra TFB-10046 SS5]|uniref:Uncharacterized protein n=1 Tax=Auricularia subglabra (strain TFB-10046 / SS5) TaxID=717982 RepID=J0WT93_AURST|nr:hypothetical protein AURDEDRAFT_174471 [Auricularia subglabra TFB-10046 SS5]